jgi:AcrR family transcriptional regulator
MDDEANAIPAPASGKCRALAMAAFGRIASEGFEGLRTRDVAADVGVNIGTLHYYFPSKESLIRAAAGHVFHKFFETLPREGPPTEVLRAHLENLRELLKTDPELWAVASEISLRAARDDAMAGTVKGVSDKWYEFLRDLVARGVADGSLPRDLDPGCVAAVLVAAIRGAGMPIKAAVRPERIDQIFDQLERWLGLEAVNAASARQTSQQAQE